MKKTISKWESLYFKKLTDSEMRKMGFEDLADNRWMYHKQNDELNIIFFFILYKNNTKNKIKIMDRETKLSYTIEEAYIKNPWGNIKELDSFLNKIYLYFNNKGLF